MKTPDIALLRKVVEWAEAEAAKPKEDCVWYQGAYEMSAPAISRTCGTCYCVAGYTLAVSGIPLSTVEPMAAAGRIAGELLGIDGEAHLLRGGLFNVDQNIAGVRHAAEKIAAGAGERL